MFTSTYDEVRKHDVAFSVTDEGFDLDGTPFQIISGSLHYFRVHPDQWSDRLAKAAQLGLNTIDTYVAWNFHSSTPDEFRTDGWRDLARFLDLAAEHGLKAIVRPGPYICAEWRNAGLPGWLTAQEMRLRTSDPRYLDAVARFYSRVLPIVAERQVSRGGNVIMVQVENEYGAYGDDKEYLRALVGLIRAEGIDVPLFTCDQANDEMLKRGSLPELLATGTFGSRSAERLEVLRRHQPTGPLMCTEFWNGWFDSWGQHHHTTSPAESARDLDDLLSAGASVNLYMFHGGTNFGLFNGANHKGHYAPLTTSYDYDAPLSEDGYPTPKFEAFRDVIARHSTVSPIPAPRRDAPEFTVELSRGGQWRNAAGDPAAFSALPSMDQIDPDSHFALYSTDIEAEDAALSFEDVRDRAFVWLDGDPVGTIDRTRGERGIALPHRSGTLSILVEDLGRVNYAARLGEPKGLIGPARTSSREISSWRAAPIPLDAVWTAGTAPSTTSIATPLGGPELLRAEFDAPADTDLFLDVSEWGSGIVWINGLLLGRYWSAGPTRTLYVPGPIVRETHNEIVVWELGTLSVAHARFVAAPDLGHTEA